MNQRIEWLQFAFNIGDWSINLGQILGIVITLIATSFLYRVINYKVLPWYYSVDSDMPDKEKNKIRRKLFSILFLMVLIILLIILRFDYILYTQGTFNLRISTLFEGILILQIARLLDRTLSRLLSNRYSESHKEQHSLNKSDKDEQRLGKTIQYIVYTIALLYTIRIFQIDYQQEVAGFNLSLSNIVFAVLILLVARFLIWIATQVFLKRYYSRKKVNVGSQYAINQLIKYVVFVISILLALDNLGIEMTVLWGGAAALLVGLGLGLQQVFMDLVSGLILLFERSIEVGDVVKVDNLVGSITQIGLRTSNLLTRDNISVIIPNSKLTVENVVNWSHVSNQVRFKIDIGVAYGSDTKLVKKTLLSVASENPYIMKAPGPFVRFAEFGDSSLNMELHFWSKNLLIAEDIKSDLRFAINEAFEENNIEIPFPQRVVWQRQK